MLDELMKGLHCRRIEVDEVWCYVGKKQRHILDSDNPNEVGDFYTWVAMDAETKMVPYTLRAPYIRMTVKASRIC